MFQPKYNITFQTQSYIKQIETLNIISVQDSELRCIESRRYNVENYFKARSQIENLIAVTLTPLHLLEIAKLTSPDKNIYYDNVFFRTVGYPIITYQATIDSESYIIELVNWINDNLKKLNPTVLAAIAYCQFLKLHPFEDGNGKTARLLVILILRKSGYSNYDCFLLEQYLEDHRDDYANALNFKKENDLYEKYDPKMDFTPWIDYFCKSFLNTLNLRIISIQKNIQSEYDSN